MFCLQADPGAGALPSSGLTLAPRSRVGQSPPCDSMDHGAVRSDLDLLGASSLLAPLPVPGNCTHCGQLRSTGMTGLVMLVGGASRAPLRLPGRVAFWTTASNCPLRSLSPYTPGPTSPLFQHVSFVSLRRSFGAQRGPRRDHSGTDARSTSTATMRQGWLSDHPVWERGLDSGVVPHAWCSGACENRSARQRGKDLLLCVRH